MSDTVKDNAAVAISIGEHNKSGFLFVIENTVNATITGVLLANVEALETSAIRECVPINKTECAGQVNLS